MLPTPSPCPAPWFDMDTVSDFPGTFKSQALGTLTLSQAAGTRHSVQRDIAQPSDGGEQCLLLTWQRRGTATLAQQGAKLRLAPGDMLLHDAGQPYHLHFEEPFEVMVARLPAAPMRNLCPLIDTLLGVVQKCRQPQVALLTAMADCHVATDYGRLPRAAALHAADAFRHTLAACALGVVVAEPQRRPSLSQYHLDRIRQYALKRIGDSDLSVNQLVEALDISAAHIHRLFAGEAQSFSTWLWETRLQLCHLALRDPDWGDQPISQIAYQYGFSHPAHFSRAYRNHFGMTPSAWRAGAPAAADHAAVRRRRP
ncbi:AraC family transcriptional regulator [Duganella phyllosphaerae]|uniref:Transcriptional activator NphR n=1 Tax=Duganella phyllosphaerae TaxID=762836 RepID=A0A1E7W6K8_9BURK|nr:AraC family transcriptional regulator [Duganella phyllosphaerae]OEZ91637.1 transcriptional activator NphR [Duganella phyllosphaerae]